MTYKKFNIENDPLTKDDWGYIERSVATSIRADFPRRTSKELLDQSARIISFLFYMAYTRYNEKDLEK